MKKFLFVLLTSFFVSMLNYGYAEESKTSNTTLNEKNTQSIDSINGEIKKLQAKYEITKSAKDKKNISAKISTLKKQLDKLNKDRVTGSVSSAPCPVLGCTSEGGTTSSKKKPTPTPTPTHRTELWDIFIGAAIKDEIDGLQAKYNQTKDAKEKESISNKITELEKELEGLIKKEIDLCEGVVPLTKYKTFTFELKLSHLPKMPHHTHIQQIVKTNNSILMDFLTKIQLSSFAFLGITDLGIILNLVNANQLYCFCLKHKKDILGYYFFKNANLQYEDLSGLNDCDTLHFIASYNNSKSVDLFILGYLYSIKAILKLKKTFKILLFDEISHNHLILPSWKKENPILLETDCAYYLYNMVVPRTMKYDNIFMLL